MKARNIFFLLIALALVPAGLAIAGTTPQTVKVQGFLSDTSGPREDPVTMLFALCTSLSGPDCAPAIPPVGGSTVDPDAGLYSVELSFDATQFGGPDRFLEITVNGEILGPRLRVVSTPYAYVAETLDGFEATELDQTSDVVSLQGQFDVHESGGGDPHSEYVKKSGDSMTGSLGIGEPSPAAPLHLSDSADAPEIRLNGDSTMTTGEVWGPISLYQSGSTLLGRIYWKGQATGSPDLHVDTRVKPEAFIIDGTTGNVGIGLESGTNTIDLPLELADASDPMLLVRTTDSNGDDAGIQIQGARNASTTADVAYIDLRNLDDDEGAGETYTMARIAGGMGAVSGKLGVLKFDTSNGASLVEAMRIDSESHVGVGTNDPQLRLHVDNGSDVLPSSGGYAMFGSLVSTNIAIDNDEIMARNNGAASTLNLNLDGGDTRIGGNLGIGVDPVAPLDVNGLGVFRGNVQVAANQIFTTLYLEGVEDQVAGEGAAIKMHDNFDVKRIELDAQDGTSSKVTLYNSSGAPRITLDAVPARGIITTDDLRLTGDARLLSGGVETLILEGDDDGSGDGGARIRGYQEDGSATFSLSADRSTSNGDIASLRMYEPGTGNTLVRIDAQEQGLSDQGAAMFLYNDSGEVTIELDAEHGTGGNGRVITDTLEIKGGSDLSEHFDVRDTGLTIEPGMVVSIDPARPGGLMLSDDSYDRRVAGVISGAGDVRPGLLMGQEGSVADGEHPVALTGRVYCRVDASYGAIEPGDLLTTSATPGHAMKVTDHALAPGATLGKAMTGLSEGQGLVLLLVALQ